MSAEQSRFVRLIELAHETSSEKRRELLREVTDVFFDEKDGARSEVECETFDHILVAVAQDMTQEVRQSISKKVAKSGSPLNRTAKRLATDTITVARPILQHAKAMSDDDLVKIVNTQSQDHLMAVSKRRGIGENVSEALVEKGQDPVVVSLLQNDTARINRQTFEKVTDRAKTSKALQAPLVRRKSVPLDLLNEMYAKVEPQLRAQIMDRFSGVSEKDLDAALAKSRTKMDIAFGGLPDDYEDAEIWVKQQAAANRLTQPMLVQLFRDGKRTRGIMGIAHFTDMPFSIVQRIYTDRDIDALAILCRAGKFEKALFTAIAVLVIGGDNGVAQANKYAEMYDKVPTIAAQRAVRFWKVRSTTGGGKASEAA